MAERDARRERVRDAPHRQAVPPQVPDRDRDGGDQPAVEHAAGPHQRHQLARILPERVEVDDQQQQLGADQRADDDPDAQVHDPVGVEAARPRTHQRELQAEQVGGRQQHAVGVDGEPADLKQYGMHVVVPSAEHVEDHEDRADRIAASATLNAQKCTSPQ